MKNLRQQPSPITGVTLFIFLLLGLSTNLVAQKPIKSTWFQILVETNETGIKLTGKKGCSFKELTFTTELNKAQAIDQDGMVALKTTQPVNKLRSFLFTITKTKEGLSFEGLEGTSWKKLSFKCPENKCFQIIDENGMFKIN